VSGVVEIIDGQGGMTTSASPSVNGACLHGVRVLVADDASYVRQAVTDILESVGAVVTTVGSAEAALTALQAEPPDVLVSDLSMPGKGGYWLIGQVRALPRERGGATPAAAFTAAGPEHRESVLNAGFQCHVAKPVGILELVEVVATLALKV
jgi:CheY-like chemotaxis protein